MSLVIIYSTFPDEESAKSVARFLVKRRLVACANIYPEGTSFYWWNDSIEESRECGVYFKTLSNCLADAVTELKKKHPYSNPAILTWEVTSQSAHYTEWMNRELGFQGDGGSKVSE
ncbi:MAG: divalent-cation tolerance protein CutA [Bdellovibrionaceae bacterium]|nr:divalent-cation tolerance protein CutA [Pseudobdellovibrionaceae bacterium]MDW8190958.1 divalent-cation tolerance protein CutA [Pseudobdellovibrionaceae bacterium]